MWAISKKQRNKKTGQQRVIEKEVETDSFFRFFESTEDAHKIEQDFEIGQHFLESLIPNSLQHYLGIQEEVRKFHACLTVRYPRWATCWKTTRTKSSPLNDWMCSIILRMNNQWMD